MLINGMTASTTSPTDLSAAASDVRMATFRLARRLRAERAVDSMSDGQFAVLAALKVHGPHTLSELAERERVTAPSMNRTVNCLQDAGHVTRAPVDDDRRKVLLELTHSGTTLDAETVRRLPSVPHSAPGQPTHAAR